MKADELAKLIEEKLTQNESFKSNDLILESSSKITFIDKIEPKSLRLIIKEEKYEAPIKDAQVVLSCENSTYLSKNTNEEGEVIFGINVAKQYSLLVGHPNYCSFMSIKLNIDTDQIIYLSERKNGGSLIIHGTGYIPGLSGRLNPILDNIGRTYFYADNIAIDDGKIQPVSFQLNEKHLLEDSLGACYYIFFRFINGNITLIDYVLANGGIDSIRANRENE